MSTAGALKKRDRRRTIDKSTMCRDRILFCQNRLREAGAVVDIIPQHLAAKTKQRGA